MVFADISQSRQKERIYTLKGWGFVSAGIQLEFCLHVYLLCTYVYRRSQTGFLLNRWKIGVTCVNYVRLLVVHLKCSQWQQAKIQTFLTAVSWFAKIRINILICQIILIPLFIFNDSREQWVWLMMSVRSSICLAGSVRKFSLQLLFRDHLSKVFLTLHESIDNHHWPLRFHSFGDLDQMSRKKGCRKDET